MTALLLADGGVTTPEGYAAAGFVLVVCLFVLRWTNRHQNDWLDDCQQALDEVRLSLRWANWRAECLARACRKGGIDVPPEIWMDRKPDEEPPTQPRL